MKIAEVVGSLALIAGSLGATIVGVRYAVGSSSTNALKDKYISAASRETVPSRFLRGQEGGVTITVFTDYERPVCARQELAIDSLLMQEESAEVRIAYRPLQNIHPHAVPAAVAAECAFEQKKLLEFHRRLFSQQSNLSDSIISQIAADTKLDPSRFQHCRDDPRTMSIVRASMSLADALNVTATPMTIVGDSIYVGVQSTSKLSSEILRWKRKPKSRG